MPRFAKAIRAIRVIRRLLFSDQLAGLNLDAALVNELHQRVLDALDPIAGD